MVLRSTYNYNQHLSFNVQLETYYIKQVAKYSMKQLAKAAMWDDGWRWERYVVMKS
jgi:hypothetical protein